MEKITSFQVDHLTLKRGVYISRVDGDIVTYDIRMRKPNAGDYMENAAMHTFEHLFATYARNSAFKDAVIYAGPMGCRTGFYFLTRGISRADALALIRDTFKFIADFQGNVPGVSEIECGNYREHDLAGAKKEARDMLPVLEGWTAQRLDYGFKE